MTFEEALIDLLHEEEGIVNEVYLDHLGKKTGGCGHLLLPTDGPLFDAEVGTPIDPELVEEWFQKDVDTCIKDAHWLHKDFDDLPRQAKVVIASMCFQMGVSSCSNFKKFHAAVSNRDWETARIEMLDSKWAKKDTPARANRMADRISEID